MSNNWRPDPYKQKADEIRVSFAYVAKTSSALANGASASINVTIDSDAPFTLVKACFFADVGGEGQTDATRVIPLVRLAINDTGSGRQLQSAPIPLASYGGTGELPFIFPIPFVFAANTTVRFTFDNYSVDTTYANVEFTLHGFKTYKVDPVNSPGM